MKWVLMNIQSLNDKLSINLLIADLILMKKKS